MLQLQNKHSEIIFWEETYVKFLVVGLCFVDTTTIILFRPVLDLRGEGDRPLETVWGGIFSACVHSKCRPQSQTCKQSFEHQRPFDDHSSKTAKAGEL